MNLPMTASRECSVGLKLVLNYIAAANAVLDAREAMARRGPATRRRRAEARLEKARQRKIQLLDELRLHLMQHGCEGIGPVRLRPLSTQVPKDRVKTAVA